MAKFIFKKQFRKRSNKDNNLITRRISSVSVFQNEMNGRFFEVDDVTLVKHERNKALNTFFQAYSDNSKYTLVEYGVPYIVAMNLGRIIQKIKRRCKTANTPVLAYVWIYDVGEENFGSHFHLVLAIHKIPHKSYPNHLKIKFKEKRIHGDIVRQPIAFKRYLTDKEVFERGYRKRVYGRSIKFKA